jgi:NADH-quinone oxidoreductase subunit A
MTNLLTFLIVAVVLTLIILILAYLINFSTTDYEKRSAYECGFEPFGDARSFFDIHFYIVGLLFIIFDLEIVFLVPLAVGLESVSAVGYISFIIFMAVLIIGFYYEWSLGLLSWVNSSKPNKGRPGGSTNTLVLAAFVLAAAGFNNIVAYTYCGSFAGQAGSKLKLNIGSGFFVLCRHMHGGGKIPEAPVKLSPLKQFLNRVFGTKPSTEAPAPSVSSVTMTVSTSSSAELPGIGNKCIIARPPHSVEPLDGADWDDRHSLGAEVYSSSFKQCSLSEQNFSALSSFVKTAGPRPASTLSVSFPRKPPGTDAFSPAEGLELCWLLLPSGVDLILTSFTGGMWPFIRFSLRLLAIIVFAKAALPVKIIMIISSSVLFILSFYFGITVFSIALFLIR